MANNNNIARDEKLIGETPGKLLADKRKQLDLSEREVADALKISVSRLRSIENSDFSVFPSETYTKGHLRNYSRFLKYDELQILSAYESAKPEPISSDLPEAGEEIVLTNNTQKKWWIVYVVLVLVVLAWVLSYWILGSNNGSFTPTAIDTINETAIVDTASKISVINTDKEPLPNIYQSSEEVERPLGDSSNELEFVSDGFSPSANPATSEALNVSQRPNENLNDAAQVIVVSQLTAAELVKSIKEKENKANALVEEEVQGDTLEFAFVNPSWVQVVDATGAVLFKGTNKPGAALELSGKAPFQLVIGNVEGTSLVYNGETISLSAPAGKNALRLTLGG